MSKECRKKPYTFVSRRIGPHQWKRSKPALESLVFASKKWIEAFRSPPARNANAEVRSVPRPAKPVHQGLAEAFDEVFDEVMARFTKAIEHLAK
jgi:hypothetical protein